jgi:phytoene synthase
LTSIHVFGFESEGALALAEKCGIAFQLTNILRDIREDAERGRVYLPAEDLRRFGLNADDLIERRLDSRFRDLMEFEWDRADGYYREAAPILGMVRPESRAGLWAMISIYYGVLRRIRDLRFDVYARRARLGMHEKVWIMARAFQMRLGRAASPLGMNGLAFP